jgi:hypothetical protein
MKYVQMLAVACIVTVIAALAAWGLIYGLGFGFGQIRDGFGILDPQVGIAVGWGSLTAVLCAFLIANSIRAAGCRERKSRLASERMAIYQTVLDATRFQQPEDRLALAERSLLLTASSPVLREYHQLRQILSDHSIDHERIVHQLGRLLVVMRRDLDLAASQLDTERWAIWLMGLEASAIDPRPNRPLEAPVAVQEIQPGIPLSL